MRVLTGAVTSAFAVAACSVEQQNRTDNGSVEWTHVAGDLTGNRFSSVSQVHRHNVSRLRLAWSIRAGDFPANVYDAATHRAGSVRSDGGKVTPVVGAQCGYCHSAQVRFEATPVMAEGRLYLGTPLGRVLALEPASGRQIWAFDPNVDVRTRYPEGLVSRGIALWRDEGARSSFCTSRVLATTVDARLIALDAANGAPCPSFGDSGTIDLRAGMASDGGRASAEEYSVTSPATVVGDVVVIGSAIQSNVSAATPRATVRAFDSRTGRLLWRFDPLPGTSNHSAAPFWSENAYSTGGAEAWSTFTADPHLGLIYIPTSSAAPDFYGGARAGRNDHANSVVALNARDGRMVWSFQVVHHDLWDYDVAAAPLLIDLRRGDTSHRALVVGSKTGMLFLLDRATGEPLSPVEERRVPQSDVPGERTWPTQPFSQLPNVHGSVLTVDSLFALSPNDRAYCTSLFNRLRYDGPFTPPSLRGTLHWPGVWGGLNWDGMAWDPDRQILVLGMKRLAMIVQLEDRSQSSRRTPLVGEETLPQTGVPYRARRAPFVAPSGNPCSPPPWGMLAAIDLANETVRWVRPVGRVPWLGPQAVILGSPIFGGPLVTAGGLTFMAASQDDMFRAFDSETGEQLWQHQLPAGGQATPMTYVHQGQQYVVIAAGGRAGIGSPGDWIVAFALP